MSFAIAEINYRIMLFSIVFVFTILLFLLYVWLNKCCLYQVTFIIAKQFYSDKQEKIFNDSDKIQFFQKTIKRLLKKKQKYICMS